MIYFLENNFQVRVCDTCYAEVTKPLASGKAVQSKTESDLPIEYLKSSLAQQNQVSIHNSEEIYEVKFCVFFFFFK